MPIYEYECAKCGERLEVIQKMSDKPLKKHAGCGGALTKLISAAGFQFKGTGWYVTDYARKGSPESAESSKSDSGDSKESTDAKDSKDKGSKETSSNGSKQSDTGKAVTEKASKKDSSAKSGARKG
jgi:putative FmdB family regulatory protein